MGVRYVGGAARCQEPADADGVDSIEGNNPCSWIADESGQADLPLGPADGLRESRGGYGHHSTRLECSGKQSDHPPVSTIQCDQATGIEGNPGLQATDRSGRGDPLSTSSAQARSSGES